jgi:S-DNA-T family DNA segregation ATPase FtsK/SpoIIIE
MVLSPLRYVILAAIIVAIGYWQWLNIVSWAESVFRFFGWGLIFILTAAGTLVYLTWRRRLLSLIRHWNYWLGSVAFILAVWGILAYFSGRGILTGTSLGGNFGSGIIGYSGFWGIFRITGLVILGFVIIAPRGSYRFAVKTLQFMANSISWLIIQIKRQPTPKYLQQQLPAPDEPTTRIKPTSVERPALPREMEKPLVPVEDAVGLEKEISAPGPVPTQPTLKQVAEEVWKKYGESPDLITVDGWKLPPIDILDRSPEIQFSQADNMQRAKLIEEALASYGVEANVIQINAGPTVTQFGVEPGWDRKIKEIKEKDKEGNLNVRQEEVSKTRVKVDRISSLGNDLALALAAPSIRIEAPVPGKSVVGIEVPNTVSSLVSLRGVIETSVFQKIQARSKLSLALGKGAGGEAISADLAKMPHLLIAGATGSGKTVCLNTIICCLLVYATPYDVQFIMIDPKRVELTTYNSIPHLATSVIVDADKALDALRWLNEEMNKRYQKLASAGIRNIELYNRNKQGKEKMPYLVLVIDELADLMMAGGDEVEHILCRLAQLARAVGIHLVVATQRPSVDVVTGLIKANFPTRISFAVTSQVDSRTILDAAGAEKLLGSGDMLFMPTEAAKPKRLQGCFVSDPEIDRLVYFWGNQRPEERETLNIDELIPSRRGARKGGLSEDPILAAARQLAREHRNISASFLQRRLRIGYPRAARIMDQLEEEKAQAEEERPD